MPLAVRQGCGEPPGGTGCPRDPRGELGVPRAPQGPRDSEKTWGVPEKLPVPRRCGDPLPPSTEFPCWRHGNPRGPPSRPTNTCGRRVGASKHQLHGGPHLSHGGPTQIGGGSMTARPKWPPFGILRRHQKNRVCPHPGMRKCRMIFQYRA